MKKDIPFFFFLLGVFLMLISPSLLTKGMFMDGMIYSAVAKNMADGIGTFWQPFFTATCYPEFFEHPPLAMGILSVFYKLLGDSFLIEKLYSFSTWLIVAWSLVKIWRYFRLENAWIPIVILMSISRIIWASTNNGLENTLAVFIILAFFFYLKSLQKSGFYLMLSGFCVAAGFLTKGPFGLFLWVLPFFYEFIVVRKSFWLSIASSLKLVVLTLAPLTLIYMFSDAAFQNLQNYYSIQVVNSLQNVETVTSRFFIVRYFFAEMILPLAMVILIFVVSYSKQRKYDLKSREKRIFLSFFLTGLCGVLPIMVSMKQSGFYILPTFPIFALAFSFLIVRILNNWIKKLDNHKYFIRMSWFFGLTVFLLGVFMNIRVYGEIGRDEDKLSDMQAIVPHLRGAKVIGVSRDLWLDWSLQAYFQRFYGIALNGNQEHISKFYILEEGQSSEYLNEAIVRISSDTKKYHLYKNTFVE
jgi:4-amino-4-deoxy-L-arabinose transferase-like glycosyltransferase